MSRHLQIFSLFILLLLTSCITEQKLADQYLFQLPESPVFIIPKYELFKDNFTVAFDTNVQYSNEQYDSIEWVQSNYIQYISDSLYLSLFTNSLITELSAQGFNVFVSDSSVLFDSLTDPKKVIRIAELQLSEEHGIEYDLEKISKNEIVTRFGFYGNSVCLNSWLEILRPDSSQMQVLHLEGCLTDNIASGINVDELKDDFDGQQLRDSIEIDDLYTMADEFGRKHAELLMDYFLTDYIRTHLPKYFAPTMEYYHYDRNSKSIVPALQERFEIVNEEGRPGFMNQYQWYDGPSSDEFDGIVTGDKIKVLIE